MVKKGLPRVEVDWIDSYVTGGWRSISSYIEDTDDQPLVQSCGYMILNTKKKIKLIQSFTESNQQSSDSITIPKGCVIKITYLKEMKPSKS